MRTFRLLGWLAVLVLMVLALTVNAQNQNPAPNGLSYPFSNPQNWEILSGYNNGNRHGGGEDQKYFYAYYGFDFGLANGSSADQPIYLPANAYYFRKQNSVEECVDFAIGGALGDSHTSHVFLEMCHLNWEDHFDRKGVIVEGVVQKGTLLGYLSSTCPSCKPPHLHIAAYFAPQGNPWNGTGFCADGLCRVPIAFQEYAHFSLAFDGMSYPPLEDN